MNTQDLGRQLSFASLLMFMVQRQEFIVRMMEFRGLVLTGQGAYLDSATLVTTFAVFCTLLKFFLVMWASGQSSRLNYFSINCFIILL